MLILALSVWISCSSGGYDFACPPPYPYSVRGVEMASIEDACESKGDIPACVFYCSDEAFCDGVVGSFYCEACASLDQYRNQCDDCVLDHGPDGEHSLSCPSML